MASRKLEIDVVAKLGDTLSKFEQLDRRLDAIDQSASRTTRSMSGMSGFLRTAAGTFAGFVTGQAVLSGVASVARGVGRAVVGMNASLETAELQFTTLTGSSKRAKEIVEGLFEFAKTTPFETGPIIEASRIMQTFGGDALNTEANLRLIGDAAAGTNAPIEDLGMWTGRLFAALQGGQPIGEAAARMMELGVITPQTAAQMREMAKAGASADEIFGLFQEQLGQFTGAMEAQAGTWSGLLSTLSDSIQLLFADQLSGVFESVKAAIAAVIEVLGSPAFGAALTAIGEAFSNAFGGSTQGMLDLVRVGILKTAAFAADAAAAMTTAFEIVKTVFFGVSTVVLGMTENFLALVQVASETARRVPGLGARFDGLSRTVDRASTRVGELRDEFAAATRENASAVMSVGAVEGSLLALGDELRTAASSTRAATTETQALVAASGGSGATGGSGGGLVQSLTEQTKEWKELLKEYDNYLVKAPQVKLSFDDLVSSVGTRLNPELIETKDILRDLSITTLPDAKKNFEDLETAIEPDPPFFAEFLESFNTMTGGITGQLASLLTGQGGFGAFFTEITSGWQGMITGLTGLFASTFGRGGSISTILADFIFSFFGPVGGLLSGVFRLLGFGPPQFPLGSAPITIGPGGEPVFHGDAPPGFDPNNPGGFQAPDADLFGFRTGGLVPRFALGGAVDSVPALLTPGEFVLNRDAVSRLGLGTVSRLNRGGSLGPQVNTTIHVHGGFLDSPSSSRRLADLVSARIRRDLEQQTRIRPVG